MSGLNLNKTDKNITLFTFIALMFYIWGGYLLPHVFDLSFLDEAYEAVMLLTLFFYRFQKKEFRIFLLIFFLYFVYGIFYSANPSNEAVVKDCIQELKPFAYIYFGYFFGINFTKTQKVALKANIIIATFFTAILISSEGVVNDFFSHPLELGMACFSYSILYYFLSDEKNVMDRMMIIFILLLGLFCTRAKYYGEFVIFIGIMFLVKSKIKFSFKYLLLICLLLVGVYYVAITKFVFYFFESEDAARSVLYAYMPTMLVDYFPFGTGFGSYASHVSGEIYSPLYYKYGLQGVYGMSPDFYSFIADTYFPVLAEFGVVGIILFLWFWYRRIKEILAQAVNNIKNYKIGLIIVGMVIIESVAGPVFVMSYGFIPLLVLGMTCREGYFEMSSK